MHATCNAAVRGAIAAVDTVNMRSNCGRVFYTNLWASILLIGLTGATEPHVIIPPNIRSTTYSFRKCAFTSALVRITQTK